MYFLDFFSNISVSFGFIIFCCRFELRIGQGLGLGFMVLEQAWCSLRVFFSFYLFCFFYILCRNGSK